MALVTACKERDLDMVKNLLKDRSVDVNEADDVGIAPLHVASFRNDVQLAKLLFTRKELQLDKSTTAGFTPLYCAAR
jgi:ankyrin repeat protein